MVFSRWHVKSNRIPASHTDVVDLLLSLRDVGHADSAHFFEPVYEEVLHDPAQIPDFSAMVERLLLAQKRGEHIAIFGDYDVDGVTASAVLSETFRMLGISHTVRLPHREHEGYGISDAIVDELVPPATVLLTVDNGTNTPEPLRHAQKKGADVIVLDHHLVHSELLSSALIVNPARADNTYPFPHLSAVGLAFKLAHTLFLHAKRGGMEKWLLDLVALGTVADRVPLRDENRAFVQWGIHVLKAGRRRGLRQLAAVANIALHDADEQLLSFQFVPRLNAAGRMEHADRAFELLVAENDEQAIPAAEKLEVLNKERRAQTEKISQDIRTRIEEGKRAYDIMCVSGPWPAGILGILAGRIVEETGKPAVVIGTTNAHCVASMRGNGTVNMVNLLQEAATLLTKFGGHAEAAGFSFPHTALPDVEAFFASKRLNSSSNTERVLDIDCILPHELLEKKLLQVLQILEPHGEGNRRPLFLLQGMLLDQVQRIGAAGDHLRFRFLSPAFPQAMASGVAFRWGQKPLPLNGVHVDVVAELHVNRFQGRERIDLHIQDIAEQAQTPVHVSETQKESLPR